MIKVGLVGCGRISKKHSEILGNNLVKGITLTAVCDIIEEKAKILGKKYKVVHYTCMHEMIKNNEIDLIVVLTESGNHAKHVIELAKYGKNIIVEKPMALTIDDADSMIEACQQNNCKLFVVKQNRFNNAVVELKDLLLNKKLGEIFLGTIRVRWSRDQKYYDQDSWRGTWKMDGGVLTNQASHHIDLLEWLIGPVDSVFAKSKTALVDIETEDTAVVILNFKNGALGVIEATTATRPKDLEGSVSVLGSKGTIVIGGFAVNKIETWNIVGQEQQNLDHLNENPKDVYGFGHIKYYNHVVDVLNGDAKILVDGFQGRKSIEIINAIYESIETEKEVFLRFKPNKCKLGDRL